MNELSRNFQPDLASTRGVAVIASRGAGVDVMSGTEIARCRRWSRAFAAERKDHRFYEIVEETMRQGFDYRYFALRDAGGEVRAVAPFFVLDQDLCAGMIGARPAPSRPCGCCGRAS